MKTLILYILLLAILSGCSGINTETHRCRKIDHVTRCEDADGELTNGKDAR